MAQSVYDKKKLIEKIEAGKKLTRQEELYYLTRVLRFTHREAERILTITSNKNPNLIID